MFGMASRRVERTACEHPDPKPATINLQRLPAVAGMTRNLS